MSKLAFIVSNWEIEDHEHRLFGLIDEAARDVGKNPSGYVVAPLHTTEGEISDIDDFESRYIKTAIDGRFAVRGCSEIETMVYDDNIVDLDIDYLDADNQIAKGYETLKSLSLDLGRLSVGIAKEFVNEKLIQPISDDEATLVAGIASYVSFDNRDKASALIYNAHLNRVVTKMGSVIEEEVRPKDIVGNTAALKLVAPDQNMRATVGISIAKDIIL